MSKITNLSENTSNYDLNIDRNKLLNYSTLCKLYHFQSFPTRTQKIWEEGNNQLQTLSYICIFDNII